MIEKEVKILEINKEDIIKKLEELNAKKVFDDIVETYYYDFPDNKLKKEGKTLRIRRMGEKLYIDLKKSIEQSNNVKVSRETRIEINNINSAKEMLKEIGMKEILGLVKKRTSYFFKGCFIEIDEIEGIPTFLEIEGEEKDIDDIIGILGLENNKKVKFNTFELLSYYSSSRNSLA